MMWRDGDGWIDGDEVGFGGSCSTPQVLATKVLVGLQHHGSRRVNGVSAKGFLFLP